MKTVLLTVRRFDGKRPAGTAFALSRPLSPPEADSVIRHAMSLASSFRRHFVSNVMQQDAQAFSLEIWPPSEFSGTLIPKLIRGEPNSAVTDENHKGDLYALVHYDENAEKKLFVFGPFLTEKDINKWMQTEVMDVKTAATHPLASCVYDIIKLTFTNAKEAKAWLMHVWKR